MIWALIGALVYGLITSALLVFALGGNHDLAKQNRALKLAVRNLRVNAGELRRG